MDGGGKDNEVGAQRDEAFQLPEFWFGNGAHHHEKNERGQRYGGSHHPVNAASSDRGPILGG